MSAFGETTWVGQVWMTAIATLIAGLPHFECRCPDGHVKPFCLALFSEASGCCCAGTGCSSHRGSRCCHARAGGSPKAFCCQNPPHAVGQRLPAAGHAVERAGCVKSLPDAAVFAVAPGKAPAAHDLSWVAGPITFAVPIPLAPRTAQVRPPWHGPWHSPPTDLVILLQRFTI